jgi:hypothetical protein
MKRTKKKNTIQGNVSDSKLQLPTILNSKDELLADLTNKIGVVSSIKKEVDRIISVFKSLEQSRKDMFTKSKRYKSMLQPIHTSLFTQVTEEVEEMACDSDTDVIENGTYHSVVKLGRGKKITNKCSPFFRVELAKKRGYPQN